MRKFAFTLLELLLVVVILTTLSTIVIPNFQNAVEDSKSKICETNLKVQQASLDIYAMEHDSMPASLSMIPGDCLERAYAKILHEKGAWKIRLAYWLVDLSERNFAFASFLQDEIVRGHKSSLICPKDKNPQQHGNASYGLSSALAGISSREYRNLSEDMTLIADCNNRTFSSEDDLDKRHVKHSILKSESYAQGINRKREVKKTGRPSQVNSSKTNPFQSVNDGPGLTTNVNDSDHNIATPGSGKKKCTECDADYADCMMHRAAESDSYYCNLDREECVLGCIP